MTEEKSSKRYDLEDRTFEFAKAVRIFVNKLNSRICNIEDGRQLIRASGAVGANYIEANESLSKKDFIMRIKICRKEANECRYWLRLLETDDNVNISKERQDLLNEATELTNIFGAILRKAEGKQVKETIS